MKRRLQLLLLMLLASLIGVAADNIQKYLPNDHDGWQNLTYGVADSTDWGSCGQKMEIVISGKYIHLAWMEEEQQNDGMYPLYYRCSSDYGKTWNKPKLIATNIQSWSDSQGYNSHWMWASGKDVRFAIPSFGGGNMSKMRYIYSTDYGSSFTTTEIAEGNLTWARYARPHIACDGKYIVIAANYDGHPIVFTSTDGGATFTEKKIDETYEIADLQVSGKRWTLFGSQSSGQAYDRWCRVFFSTSNDGGKTVSTENIAHAAANGKTYSDVKYLTGWNRATFDYHQQMVQQGNIIDLVYVGSLSDGNEGDPDPGYDYRHTIHRRSTDGGKTWSEAKYLPESSGGENVIAAKGDNIYIYSGWKGSRHIFYSHDGGKTWNVNEMATKTNDQWNPYNDYNLVIAPDDTEGKHVYLTGERGYFVETRDGFKTINRMFALPSEQWYGYGDHNNWGMRVLVDDQGTEHWFMHFSPLYKGFEKYFWSIVHRRNDPVANTTNQNMALSIEDHPDKYGNSRPYHLLNVPMTPSLHEIKKAITVECWVRIDSIQSFQIAALTDKSYNGQGSNYEGGWYMGVDLSYSGGDFVTLVTGMTTELSVDGVGTQYWDRDRYHMKKDGLGMWHHFAFTYDSSVEKDNFRTYADGMLLGMKTLRGDIMQGHNAITIGKTQTWVGDFAQVDNFAIWDRALSDDELRGHLYNAPTGKENGCRLLLTFDGSLQDQSPYHNDAIALTALSLKAHDGIRAPHPEFTATKDITGKIINLTDMTQDGNACWWILPDKWSLGNPEKYSTQTGGTTVQHDVRNHGSTSFNGLYTYYMAAKGTGNYNAYASTSQMIIISGLSKVFPEESAQSKGVRLRIQGGYNMTYSNQPKVVLKQGSNEIEGKWLIEYGFDMSKVLQTADDLPEASFDMSAAPLGKYDVIVGSDTLSQAFTLTAEDNGIPDVWMQVNGRGASLWNKWQRYTIDYGNRSGVAAYNTPIIIVIPDRHGTVDVSFDFDFYLCDPALDDNAQEWARQMGDYIKVYDEQTKDSIRVYSFMIPYIAPNSTNHRSFLIKMAPGTNEPSTEIKIGYWIEQPWGPNDYADAATRAPYTLEQGECFAKEWASAVFDTAISFIPGASCINSIAKAGYSTATGAEGKWSTLFLNAADVFFNCGSEVIPGSSLVKGLYNFGSKAWDLYSKYKSLKDMRGCLKGDPNDIRNKGRGSYDPNEMIGPWGPDDNAHYIKPIHEMGYTITFENKASATAPAHEVFVTDTLDLSKYDTSTFSFTNYGWADTTLVVGGSYTKEFTRDVQYKVNGHDIKVRVSGQFDPETGIARWAFVSLDKNGNEIDDPDLGFLVPNNDNRDGEGFVNFIIEHKKNPANGSTVSNKATIVFDANDPIVTNTYVNTFDTDYPTSKVTKVEEKNGQLVISFSGQDATSGIDYYTIYAIKNGGEPEAIATRVTKSPVTVDCEAGTEYAICSIATDCVGWNEPKDVKGEVTLTTSGQTPQNATVTVSDAGYATFYDSKTSYKLPKELKAFIYTGQNSDGSLSKVYLKGDGDYDEIPADMAVVVEAQTKGKATYTLTSTGGKKASATNLLYGSDVATTTTANGNCAFYKLCYGEAGTALEKWFGWFPADINAGPFRSEAHRAWLAIPKSSTRSSFAVDGEVMGISPLTNAIQNDEGVVYTLDGRQLNSLPQQKGVYIINRKKVVVK
jgi:hypothetical protein